MLLQCDPQLSRRRAACKPVDLSLELIPGRRFEVVDLRSRFAFEHRAALAPYPRCLYWSPHTTAGFPDLGLTARLSTAGVQTFVGAFRSFFPEGAGYQHDQMEQRVDLDSAQRATEPRDADSHLAFIAGGLGSCVTQPNTANDPVLFVDLDGVVDGRHRRRQMRVIGFTQEAVVARTSFAVPVSGHPIEVINLKDPRLGLYDELQAFAARSGVATGRVRLSLGEDERHSGLTVNEFEPLLMKHDLAEVLRNPLRFAAERYRDVLSTPRAVAAKTLGCATYDFVRVLNSAADALGIVGSLLETVLARTLAVPAARFFRMRRSVSLPISNRDRRVPGIVDGRHQSPILVQWQKAPRQTRRLDVTLSAFV